MVVHIQDMRRAGNKGERLGLTDLLAKPHQRIPRYRLLIQVSFNMCSMRNYSTATATPGMMSWYLALLGMFPELCACVWPLGGDGGGIVTRLRDWCRRDGNKMRLT